MPNRGMRNFVLLIFSLGFYAWGEPAYVFLMLFSMISNYLVAIFLDNFRKNGNMKMAKTMLVFGVLLNLGMLGFFKYTDFFIQNINLLLKTNIPLVGISLPI
jgi:alginate O-acetyltransferase complex protein AlgI